MKTDLFMTVLVSMMVNAVIFGIGAITVLSVPAFNEHAKFLLPVVVIMTFALTPFVAKVIAPRLRLRYWRASSELPASH
ncbi:MAG: hypothetical protein ACOH2J_08550 [Allorhizobium sp.]